MTPILDNTAVEIQTRFRPLGRIRTGALVPTGSGEKTRPAKLDHFRLTSPAEDLIHKVAALYGGEVKPWKAPSGDQWQVEITADSIPIILPPNEQLDQWMEMWNAGGCERKCDGFTETITQTNCLCPTGREVRAEMAAKGMACQTVTRLRVMLPEIPGLGIWKLETRSVNAAAELKGVLSFLENATSKGLGVRCALRLEQRKSTQDGQTHRYAVPVIDILDTLDHLITDQLVDDPMPRAMPVGDGPRGTQRVSLGPPIDVRTLDRPALGVPTEELQGENEQLARKVIDQLFPKDITVGGEPITVVQLLSRFVKEKLPDLHGKPMGSWTDDDWSSLLEAANNELSAAQS